MIKNKLLKSPKEEAARTVHINVCFGVQGEQHTGEIQLILEDFLIALDLNHKYYEFQRASQFSEVLLPIFNAQPDLVVTQTRFANASSHRSANSKLPPESEERPSLKGGQLNLCINDDL